MSNNVKFCFTERSDCNSIETWLQLGHINLQPVLAEFRNFIFSLFIQLLFLIRLLCITVLPCFLRIQLFIIHFYSVYLHTGATEYGALRRSQQSYETSSSVLSVDRPHHGWVLSTGRPGKRKSSRHQSDVRQKHGHGWKDPGQYMKWNDSFLIDDCTLWQRSQW